jgi:hypothetical protein
MQAAAHTKGGFGGVPQKVGKEFVKADKKMKGGGFFNMFKKSSEKSHEKSPEKAAANANAKWKGYRDKEWIPALEKSYNLNDKLDAAQREDYNTEYAKRQYEEQKKICEDQKRIYDECTANLNLLYKEYKNSTLKITDRLKAVASVGLKAFTGTRSNIANAKYKNQYDKLMKTYDKADELKAIADKQAKDAADKQKQLEDSKVTLRETTTEVAAARDASIDAQTAAAAAAPNIFCPKRRWAPRSH